jgi:CheY-like chemotaxis protein
MDEIPSVNAQVRARILVAEDYVDTAESMAKLLRIFGHEVQVAHDGPQAIATALSWRPEVVLLDIGLPTKDGYEVARQLRQEPTCRDIVIIAVTGYGQEVDLQRGRAAGIDHHLLKPVESSVLLPLLSRSEPLARAAGQFVCGASFDAD